MATPAFDLRSGSAYSIIPAKKRELRFIPPEEEEEEDTTPQFSIVPTPVKEHIFTPPEATFGSVLDDVFLGGGVHKTIAAAQKFAQLPTKQRQVFIDIATGKVPFTPSLSTPRFEGGTISQGKIKVPFLEKQETIKAVADSFKGSFNQLYEGLGDLLAGERPSQRAGGLLKSVIAPLFAIPSAGFAAAENLPEETVAGQIISKPLKFVMEKYAAGKQKIFQPAYESAQNLPPAVKDWWIDALLPLAETATDILVFKKAAGALSKGKAATEKFLKTPEAQTFVAKAKTAFQNYVKERQLGLGIEDVSGLESQIKDLYKNQGQHETYPDLTKADEVMGNISAELQISEPGYRLQNPTTKEFFGIKSTFPDWIPEHLRSKELFDKVLPGLDVNNLKFPSGNRPKQRALFNILLDEVDARLGVDTSQIRNQIIDSYESTTKPGGETKATKTATQSGIQSKTTESVRGSIAGSEGRGRPGKKISQGGIERQFPLKAPGSLEGFLEPPIPAFRQKEIQLKSQDQGPFQTPGYIQSGGRSGTQQKAQLTQELIAQSKSSETSRVSITEKTTAEIAAINLASGVPSSPKGKRTNLPNQGLMVLQQGTKEGKAQQQKQTPLKIASKKSEVLLKNQTFPTLREAENLRETSQQTVSSPKSYLESSNKIEKSQTINTDRLDIPKEAKQVIVNEFENVRTLIEEKTGKVLTNKEAILYAENTAKVLERAIGRKETLQWEAGLLKLRQRLAEGAQSGRITREFLEDLKTFKTISTDAGRKLQSFSIQAEAKGLTPKQIILEEVLKLNDNIDEILKAAEGVDFNDFKQQAEFYRQFVKPKIGEWVDLIRYNSMLSSPLTHIVNIFSNLTNTIFRVPLTKLVTSGVDLFSSAVLRKARTQFAGESGAYIVGYLKNFREAFSRFGEVWKGVRSVTNLDLHSIPRATKGKLAVLEKFLSVPMKLLEGADQFFTALSESGERAALSYRQTKGVKVPRLEEQALEAARYGLFRNKPLEVEGQGTILDAIDRLTLNILSLRNSQNPLIRIPAKLTLPFVQTPINIFKQGIEYSPLGFVDAIKSANKAEQFSKALIGTGIATTAAALIVSNRMTWSEPKTTDEKNAWREMGVQPYSIKIGDTWYSYQKLPPFLSFPFSFIAATYDANKNAKIDDDTLDVVLSSFSKYGEFLADQSYFKSIGDLVSAISGDKQAVQQVIGNYPQQFVPYRALSGWFARMTDASQRQIDNKANLWEKQVQLLLLNIPGMSQTLPARLGPSGEPISQPNRFFNAFSPIRTTAQTPKQAAEFEKTQTLSTAVKRQNQERALLKEEALTVMSELRALTKEEATARLSEIKQTNLRLFEKVIDAIEEKKLGLTYTDKKIKQLGVENGERAEYFWEEFEKFKTNEEKKEYLKDLARKKLVSVEIIKQMAEIKKGGGIPQQPKGKSKSIDDTRGLLGLVSDYVKAFTTDPENAWKALTTKEELGVIKGNLVEMQRFYGLKFTDKGGSQEYKKKRMEEMGIPWSQERSYKLEHVLPVKAGGDTSDSNLIPLNNAQHDFYTPIDILMAKAVQSRKITRKQAQKLAIDFKINKTITAEQLVEALK